MNGTLHWSGDGSQVTITGDGGQSATFSREAYDSDPQACVNQVGGIKGLVPESITRGQAKIALHTAGLLTQIEALIAAVETPMAIKIAWADEPRFYRDSAAINALAATIGLTSEQLDDLFRAAAQIAV